MWSAPAPRTPRCFRTCWPRRAHRQSHECHGQGDSQEAAGSAAEVASAVLFLASEDAGYITGQALSVSGGLTM
ncbi:SDR family oxidoreductase [Arthrobacter sp. UYEF21]|uniref:SDR family oxidoreductase n=1 Tax=Arthrobacter sp. UYEF21 TaxID=1756364 RepID=UPI003396EDCE